MRNTIVSKVVPVGGVRPGVLPFSPSLAVLRGSCKPWCLVVFLAIVGCGGEGGYSGATPALPIELADAETRDLRIGDSLNQYPWLDVPDAMQQDGATYSYLPIPSDALVWTIGDPVVGADAGPTEDGATEEADAGEPDATVEDSDAEADVDSEDADETDAADGQGPVTLPDVVAPDVQVDVPPVDIVVPDVPPVDIVAMDVPIDVPPVDIAVPDVPIDVPPVDIVVPDVPIDVPPVDIVAPDVPIDVPPVDIAAPDVPIDVPPVDIAVPDVPIDIVPVDVAVPDVPIDVPPVDIAVPDVPIDVPPVDIAAPDVPIDVPPVDIAVPDVPKDIGPVDVIVPDVLQDIAPLDVAAPDVPKDTGPKDVPLPDTQVQDTAKDSDVANDTGPVDTGPADSGSKDVGTPDSGSGTGGGGSKGPTVLPWPISAPSSFQPAKVLYDPTGYHVIALTLPKSSWNSYLAGVAAHSAGSWYAADVTIDGSLYKKVGIKSFGYGSTLSNPGKPNVKIAFNHYSSTQKGPAGVKALRLKASGQDPSFLRQPLFQALVNQLGGSAPRFSWSRTSVNGENYGFYQVIENADKAMYHDFFGNNDGHQYENTQACEGLNCPGGNCAAIKSYYKAGPGNFTDLIKLVSTIKNGSSGGWVGAVQGEADLDNLMAYEAMEAFAADVDGLSAAGQNFSIYGDEKTGALSFIPTGPDLTFGNWNAYYDFAQPWGPPNSWCPNRTDDFYKRAWADSQTHGMLIAKLKAVHCQVFSTSKAYAIIDGYKKLLGPDLYADPKKNVSKGEIDAEFSSLKSWISGRNAKLDKVVGGCK
jgi:hypothetical protein